MNNLKDLENFDLDSIETEETKATENWDYAVVVESYDWIIAECGHDLEAAKKAQSNDLDAMIIKRYFDENGEITDTEIVDDGYSEYNQDRDYSDDDLYDPFPVDESITVEITADNADELKDFAKAILGDDIDFFNQDFDDVVPEAEIEVPAVVDEPECEGPECDAECEGPECGIDCEGSDLEPEFVEPEPEFKEPAPEDEIKDDNKEDEDKDVDLAECSEDYTGNPEERTTHLEYTDDVPTDDKFPMPKNITKKEDTECKINKGILHDEDSAKELDESVISGINESYSQTQVKEVIRLCNQIGIKTLADLKTFNEQYPGDLLTALTDYKNNLGKNFRLPKKERGLYSESVDDMTDEEFVEAFGKALAEKRAKLEEDKDDFNPDDAASDELDAEADEANEIKEISLKDYAKQLHESVDPVVDKCNFDIQNYEVGTHQGDNDAFADVDILGPNEEDWTDDNFVTLHCETGYSTDDIDFKFEPDGDPTYVPYGEQSVLYDNGKGGVSGADLRHFSVEIADWYFLDSNGNKISDEQAAEILEVSDVDLNKIIDEAKKKAEIVIEDYIYDNIADAAGDWDWE